MPFEKEDLDVLRYRSHDSARRITHLKFQKAWQFWKRVGVT